MTNRWSKNKEIVLKQELLRLYVKENKTIGEIAKVLRLGQSTVYKRLLRFKIKPEPAKKDRYKNINHRIIIPEKYSSELAEFVGILLGDGHLNPTQVMVTLGNKDEYVDYVCILMEKIFRTRPKVITTKEGHHVIYLGSTRLVKWFLDMGLSFNKIRSQVTVPRWCFNKKEYVKNVVRGLIDTDGSVYRLRSGRVQISFCNRSIPLLKSARKGLVNLGFAPSKISGYNIYLTRKDNIHKYYEEIGFSNKKNEKRFVEFYFKNGGVLK